MKRRVLVLFVALALFLSACGSGQVASEVTPTLPHTGAPTFTVQRGDIIVEAKLSGRVVPLASETVYFQITGQVGGVCQRQRCGEGRTTTWRLAEARSYRRRQMKPAARFAAPRSILKLLNSLWSNSVAGTLGK